MVGAISNIGGISPYQSMMGMGRFYHGNVERMQMEQAAQQKPVSQQETGMQLKLSSEGTIPVQPVPKIRPLGAPIAHTMEGVDLAQKIQQGQNMDPAELAVRLRMQMTNGTEPADPAAVQAEGLETKNAQEIMKEGECQTCAERKYQDGSDDPGVSFKTAAHIAPEEAAAVVRGHEMEHVYRNQAKAEREGREVVSQSVTLHNAICPECGTAYVSGGTTRTTTAAKPEPSEAVKLGEHFSAVA